MTLDELSTDAMNAADLELCAMQRTQSRIDSSRSSLDSEIYCRNQRCDVHVHDDVSIDDPEEVARAYSCHSVTDSRIASDLHEQLRHRLQVTSLCQAGCEANSPKARDTTRTRWM